MKLIGFLLAGLGIVSMAFAVMIACSNLYDIYRLHGPKREIVTASLVLVGLVYVLIRFLLAV